MRRTPKPRTTYGRRFYPLPIEREAEACAARCLATLGLSEVPVPVPVEQWVEGPLGIRFGVEDLSHLGPDVLGAAFIAEREMLVSEALLRNEGRFRFTCAHELGHFVLHGKLNTAFRDADQEPGTRTDLHEREADRFAAAFLMPASHVVRLIVDACGTRRADPLSVRDSFLSSNADLAADAIASLLISELSTRFVVSRAAAAFRLKELMTPEVGAFMSAVRPPWCSR